MKHIPFAYVKKFSDSINTITDQAKVKLRAALMGVDLSDPQKARDEIAELMERIVGASDAMAATMAAGFYDGIREYQTGEKLGALADSGREPDSTKRATYGITYTLAKAETPDISMVEGLLVQRIGYEIQRSVGRTMYRNGQRDPNKPKFARVPTGGADSCEFCRMLASRGFAYNSERTAGKFDPDHYHDGCNCRVVCSWEDDPILDGFTPEEYDDKAWDTYGGDAKSYASRDHSKHKQHQQEKRRNRYTDDGKLRAGYSGERIDKQAAYTEADRKKVAARAAAQRGNTQRGISRNPKNAISHVEKRISNGEANVSITHTLSVAGTGQMRTRGVRQFLGNLTPEEFDAKRRDIEAASKRKTIQVSAKERRHVESELNTNLSADEWKRGVVTRPIGDYLYTVVVYGFNNFRIIGRKALK